MEENANTNEFQPNIEESSSNKREPINFTPKSESEVKNQEKSRRTEKIIGAIGDGLMSLSNLFFTTKGAPSIIGEQQKGKQNLRKSTFLTKAIQERHKAEDKEYENRYNNWKKEQEEYRKNQLVQQKEEERNRRIQLSENFGIKISNWEQEDFVNQLFEGITEWNTDKRLSAIINNLHYDYEPIWEWMGSNWAYEEGHDKKVDLFKGKNGTYLKRDIIETIFGDESWTTPENRKKLMDYIREFENNWIPIK